MAGGSSELFERLRPLLGELCANVTLMGGPGAGQTTKIINQAIVGVNYVLMGEVLAMVRAAGIDGAKLADCLAGLGSDVLLSVHDRLGGLVATRRYFGDAPPAQAARGRQLEMA